MSDSVLCDALLSGWQKLAMARDSQPGDAPSPLNGYVLLDGWADNPFAEALEAQYPQLAQERCAVPDKHFDHRKGDAPCLFPLPAQLAPSAPAGTLAARPRRIPAPQMPCQRKLANGLQGTKCAAQVNGIIEGMGGGGAACEDKLMAWAMDHADNPRNLLWRGYLMNQADAQARFKAAMEKAKAPETTAAEYVEQFKVQIDKFAKFNDLVAGSNDMSIKLSRAIPLFGFSPILNLIGHAIFKAGSGKLGAENSLARALMVSLVAGAGSPAAIELHARQRWNLSQITPERFRASPYFKWGQENLKLESQMAINKIMAEGRAGEFFKMRLTGLMTLTEGILLTFKARQLGGASDVDAAQRAAWELGAAAMTTTAAALDVGAMTQEWLAGKMAGTSRATMAMAEIRLGGFKLAANALAGVAGIVSACLDKADGDKARDEKKRALMLAFYSRAALNGMAFAGSMAMGFSYAGPLLKHWSKQVGGNAVLDGAESLALRFALGRAVIFATTLWLTLAVVTATSIIGKLGDDEMQKWCKRSGFRKPGRREDKPEPLYDKAGEELVALYGAFKAIAE